MSVQRRSLRERIARRIMNPRGAVLRQGEFITFEPSGFVAAADPSALFFRHYYEIVHLRRCLSLAPEMGVAPGESLEIGCGYGRLSPIMAEYFEQHTAVDINSWGISQARLFYPHVAFSEASVTKLPFPDHRFDAVVTWTVLQHIPNHLIETALNEIKRVAKPKALIVLCETTLHAGEPETKRQHTHDRFPEFYAKSLAPFQLIVSEFFPELDRVPHVSSPGQLMVFGPKN